jgi:hypothetical protein
MEATRIVNSELECSTPPRRLKLNKVSIQRVSESVATELNFAAPVKQTTGYLCTCDSSWSCCAP